MEAKKYFEERTRIFNSLRDKEDKNRKSCYGVSCRKCHFNIKLKGCVKDLVESVDIVEKWSKEHPKKTMLMDLLEKYPNTILSLDNQYPELICPYHIGYEELMYCTGKHGLCCEDCWNREYE